MQAVGHEDSIRRCLQALAAPLAGPESLVKRVSQVGELSRFSTKQIGVLSLRIMPMTQWAIRS